MRQEISCLQVLLTNGIDRVRPPGGLYVKTGDFGCLNRPKVVAQREPS